MTIGLTDEQVATEIELAFPTRSGRHDLYADAQHLVGARHEKWRLVALVTWLLLERSKATARADDAERELHAARNELWGKIQEIAQLRERVSLLEDTIDLTDAEDRISSSYGRASDAAEIAREIHARRGENWAGELTTRERAQ